MTFIPKKWFWWLAAALVALLLAAQDGRAGGRVLYRYRTEHYEVRTDISPLWAEVVGRHMEEIYGEYSRRFASYGSANEEFDVYVFRTRKGYASKVPSVVAGSNGVFVGGPDYLAAHAEDRTPEEVLRTLYHEGLHQFVYEVVSEDCPVWINEGMAEYFAEATWNGSGFQLGQVPSAGIYAVQDAIKRGSYIRFRALFAMTPESWIETMRRRPAQAGLAYPQVWSIVHFLLHGGGGRFAGSTDQFLRLIAHERDQEEALETAFGPNLSLKAFEKAWADHVMSLKPGPKFHCRANMEGLMTLAKGLNPRRLNMLRTVDELREVVLASEGWRLPLRDRRTVRADDREAVEALFQCPFDRSGRAASYLVVRDPSSHLPVLVCTHHPGIIIKAYYERNGDGDLEIKVEEEVRSLLKPEFRDAISAKVRGLP